MADLTQDVLSRASIPAGQAGSPWSVPTATGNTPPVTAPVSTTSNSYRQGIADTGTAINNGLTTSVGNSLLSGFDSSALTGDYNAVQTNLQNRQTTLKAERDQELANITSSFDSQKTDLGHSQASETGTQSASLARIGGYLGDNASGMGASISLQNLHVQQIQGLEAKRQAALLAAQQAYSEKDFALADKLVQESKQYHSDMLAAQKQYADQTVQQANLEKDKVLAKQKEQEIQQAAQDFAIKYSIPADKPFYSIGGTVYRTADRKPATSPEDYAKMGGKGDFSDVFALTGNAAAERDMVKSLSDKYGDAGILPGDTIASATKKLQGSALYQKDASGKYLKYTDNNGNEQFFNPASNASTNFGSSGSIGNTVTNLYPDGTVGGQCGVFAEQLTDCPTMGDTIASKDAMIDKQGVKADQWRQQGPKVGDVLIFNLGANGHAAVVNSVNPDGTVTLSESNYNLDGKVTNSRTVSTNDPTIYGAYRGTLNSTVVSQAAIGTTGTPTIDATKPGYATNTLPNAGGLTQSAVDQQALSYVLSGQKPPRSAAKGPARQQATAILNRMGEIDAGGNIQANKAELTALSKTLTEQTQYLANTQRSLKNAENGFNQITTAFKNSGINTSESTFLNAKANAAFSFFGKNTEALKSFQAGLFEVQNEYAQVFARGGQRNIQGDQHAQDILSGNISIKDLLAIQNELQAQGEIVVNGTQAQVKQAQDQINNIISPGHSSTTSNTAGLDNINFLSP